MLTFEKAIVKKYWPAEEKGEDNLIIRQVVLQVEAEIENGLQVSELYKNMVRGLNRVLIMDNLSGEEYELPAVTIKPFNIKQKKITIGGKGEENAYVKQEYAALTLVCRADEDSGAKMLADLYRFFNIEVQLSVDEFGSDKKLVDDDEDQSATM